MNTAKAFLSAMKQINPTEWAGPCPFCGDGGKGADSDRFHFWTDNPKWGQAGRFWCRKCDKSGDGVELVRQVQGVGYHEALRLLGLESGASSLAMRKATATVGDSLESVAEVSQVRDVVTWRKVAGQFLASCQQELHVPENVPSEAVVENLLVKRCLGPATAIALGIGYYHGNKYVDAEAWGIDGSATNSGKIRIPGPGVVIASQRQGQVVGLYVHFAKPEKYANGAPCKGRVIRGSAKDTPFIAGQPGKPCFILESALDAALIWQEGAGRVSAIGMNGGRKPVDGACMEFIRQSPFLILCGDRDANGAGDVAMQAWHELFSFAVPCHKQYAVGAKDIGEMHSKAIYDCNIPSARDFINVVLSQRALT